MKYYASEVVKLMQSWVGKNEADGSFRFIVDLYNSFLPHPRSYKLKYTDAWCAGTVSAAAIKLGYTAIMPVECSCYYMIEQAKVMGIWVEDDNHIPEPGQHVLYDWQDNSSGSGDNKGVPDHIGTVETVNKSAGTFVVIEGNYKNAVTRRTMKIGGRYIRGYICPKYDSESNNASDKKSVSEVAKDVIAGKYGTGITRFTALEKAGYDANEVQAEVNRILGKSNASNTPNTSTNAYTLKGFIKDVQSATGASVDGIAGSETISKTVTVSAYINNDHAVVKPIQRWLNELGYDCGKVDGEAGPLFTEAVKKYQEAKGCVSDGEITAENKTWKCLLGML